MAMIMALPGSTTRSGEQRLRRESHAYQKWRLCQGRRLVAKYGSPITASIRAPPSVAVRILVVGVVSSSVARSAGVS